MYSRNNIVAQNREAALQAKRPDYVLLVAGVPVAAFEDPREAAVQAFGRCQQIEVEGLERAAEWLLQDHGLIRIGFSWAGHPVEVLDVGLAATVFRTVSIPLREERKS